MPCSALLPCMHLPLSPCSAVRYRAAWDTRSFSLVDPSCASRCAAQLLQCRSVGRGYTMRHARAHTTWGMARSIQRCTLRAARCVDVCRMPYALCFTFITCCLPSYNRQHATCNRRQATCNRRCACSILRTRCTARNELLTLRSVAEQNRALQHQIEVCGAAAGNRPAALLPQIEAPTCGGC